VTSLLQLSRAAGVGRRVHTIDSHTEGEPTRVIYEGAPDLGRGAPADRVARLVSEYEPWRRATVNGPRGSEGVVAALLLPPEDETALTQVLYYNAKSPLPMCVHATIGLVETLRHYGEIGFEQHRLETVAGTVTVRALEDGRVEVENVPSAPWKRAVEVPTSHGTITGDIAWGGNWFFVAHDPQDQVRPAHIDRLLGTSEEILNYLTREGMGGRDGAVVDHVYFMGSPNRADAAWRSFVLCPDGNYDRSPCGTGTSAAMACQVAAGAIDCDREYVFQSVTGTTFEASVAECVGGVRPTLRGRAYITAESVLVFHDDDPFGGRQ
jgi:proline racemase